MIKSLQRVSLAIPALLVAFTALAAVPVYARGGVSGSGSSSDPVTTTSTTELQSGSSRTLASTTSSSDSTAVETETRTTSGRGSDSTEVAEMRAEGIKHVAELKKEDKSTRTDAERTKVCEVHKQGLTTKFTVIARNSASFQTRIDDVYTKAMAYQTSNKISTTDLTALIVAADSARATSATSVANLQNVTPPSIDCNNASVAQDVATFKVAATQTRTDLKAYKAAVKAVLQALKAATDTTTTKTTEGSN